MTMKDPRIDDVVHRRPRGTFCPHSRSHRYGFSRARGIKRPLHVLGDRSDRDNLRVAFRQNRCVGERFISSVHGCLGHCFRRRLDNRLLTIRA